MVRNMRQWRVKSAAFVSNKKGVLFGQGCKSIRMPSGITVGRSSDYQSRYALHIDIRQSTDGSIGVERDGGSKPISGSVKSLVP